MKILSHKLAMAVMAVFPLLATGADKVFTGEVDGKWSTPGNWQGGEVPVNGDSVTLASTVRTTINNDIEGLTLANFTFSGYGNKGAGGNNNEAWIQGKPIKIAAGGAIAITSNVRLNQQMTIELLEGAHTLAVSTVSGSRWDCQNTGFTGAGSLTLTTGLLVIYAGSSYTGGFTAKSGTDVFLFHNNGLGAGAATFENNAFLTLYKSGLTIPNDITFKGETSSVRQGNIRLNYSATFTGALTLSGTQRISSGTGWAAATLTFKGPVTQTSGIFVTNLGVSDLRHEIIFENVFTGTQTLWMDGNGSVVRFRAPGNQIASTRLSGGCIHFEVDGACTAGTQLSFLAGNVATVYIEGRQSAKHIFRHSGNTTDFAVSSENGGELAVFDTQNTPWPGRLAGQLGFIWAPTGNYTFTAQGETSMSGRLVVSNGTFAVASGQAGLPNISSLVLANSASLVLPSGAAINTRLDTLEITSSATLTLPDATAFTVDHFVVDGEEMAEDVTYTGGAAGEGQVHCDALPANVTVYTRVQPGPGARTVWNGAGGSTDGMDLGVNWEGGVAPRLWEKCLPVFAGGSSATLAADTKVNGLAFETPGAFTMNGAHFLDLYWGGLSGAQAAAARTQCIFNVPVRICGAQEWKGATDSGPVKEFVFNKPVTDGDVVPYPVVITNGAHVVFNATNTFSGDLTLHSGHIGIGASESLGNPEHGTVTLIRPNTSTETYLSFGPNTKVSRPVTLYGPDSNYYPVRADSAGTNEFAGPVVIGDNVTKRFRSGAGNTLLFTGGITGIGMFYVQGYGKYVIAEKPLKTTGTLYSDVRADLTFKVGGNSVGGITWTGSGSVMRLDVDDAFPGKPTLSVGGGSRIELNGHELRVGNLVDKSSGNTVDTVVASDEPATLIATPGSSGIASHTRFEGAASFVKAGGYSMSLKSLSSSTGSVCVTQSTLLFEGGTGWTNGTVVVTNGNAAVMFNPGARLGKNVDVHLAHGGKLTLVTDAEIVCRNLYLDGERQRIGTYGNALSTAANRSDTYFMAGESLRGKLVVRGDGTGVTIIIR